jgi:hypothetical protein
LRIVFLLFILLLVASQIENTVFSPVEEFFPRQANRYDLPGKELVRVRLGPEVETMPPVPPKERRGLAVVWWSLKLRFWAMRTGLGMDGPPADIRIYVIYHDPARHPRLAHSLGLKEGLIGVVNAYASKAYSGRNNVVAASRCIRRVMRSHSVIPCIRNIWQK